MVRTTIQSQIASGVHNLSTELTSFLANGNCSMEQTVNEVGLRLKMKYMSTVNLYTFVNNVKPFLVNGMFRKGRVLLDSISMVN
jgi:hypothetical protein